MQHDLDRTQQGNGKPVHLSVAALVAAFLLAGCGGGEEPDRSVLIASGRDDHGRVVQQAVSLSAEPEGPAVAEVPEGSLVSVLHTRGEWIRVRSLEGAGAGWVNDYYLRGTAHLVADVRGCPVRARSGRTFEPNAQVELLRYERWRGEGWVRVRALKGFVDGIQGNSTARFYEPQLHSGKRGEWRDSTNTAATDGPGSGMMPPGNMERLLFGLDSAGWWANVHAIGDEAIDSVLTIMEKVMRTNGPKERRWRVIHSQVIRNAAVAQKYKRLGLIAEVQPYHAIDDMRWMEQRIGERAKWAYAFRTFHDAGVPLLFGSDWPGTNASWYTANPMTILYAAVTRQTLDGKPEGGWFPEQRLDLETSLRSYTVNNAWAEGEEANKGSLSAGRLADFVVIDRDLFAIPPAQLKDATVLLTVVGGRVVHAAAPFTP